jgi:hypothetical protein
MAPTEPLPIQISSACALCHIQISIPFSYCFIFIAFFLDLNPDIIHVRLNRYGTCMYEMHSDLGQFKYSRKNNIADEKKKGARDRGETSCIHVATS